MLRRDLSAFVLLCPIELFIPVHCFGDESLCPPNFLHWIPMFGEYNVHQLPQCPRGFHPYFHDGIQDLYSAVIASAAGLKRTHCPQVPFNVGRGVTDAQISQPKANDTCPGISEVLTVCSRATGLEHCAPRPLVVTLLCIDSFGHCNDRTKLKPCLVLPCLMFLILTKHK